MAYALLHAVTLVLAPGCLPVFTSDGLDLYFYATLAPARSAGVTAHFGQWFTDPATGKAHWLVVLDLLYGQVKKTYRRRKLHSVERRRRLSDLALLTDRLTSLGFSGSLNTAFIERLNPSLRSGQALTLHHTLAALSRRSWATALRTPELEAHLEWGRAYPQGAFGSYHFCHSHLSLRFKLDVPQTRRGKQTPRRYGPRTPAMAAGLNGSTPSDSASFNRVAFVPP